MHACSVTEISIQVRLPLAQTIRYLGVCSIQSWINISDADPILGPHRVNVLCVCWVGLLNGITSQSINSAQKIINTLKFAPICLSSQPTALKCVEK